MYVYLFGENRLCKASSFVALDCWCKQQGTLNLQCFMQLHLRRTKPRQTCEASKPWLNLTLLHQIKLELLSMEFYQQHATLTAPHDIKAAAQINDGNLHNVATIVERMHPWSNRLHRLCMPQREACAKLKTVMLHTALKIQTEIFFICKGALSPSGNSRKQWSGRAQRFQRFSGNLL